MMCLLLLQLLMFVAQSCKSLHHKAVNQQGGVSFHAEKQLQWMLNLPLYLFPLEQDWELCGLTDVVEL